MNVVYFLSINLMIVVNYRSSKISVGLVLYLYINNFMIGLAVLYNLWSLSFDDFETVSFIWFCPPTDQIRPINVKCHWRGLSHTFSTEPSLVWQNINFIKSEKRGKKCSPKIYMFVKKGQIPEATIPWNKQK